MSESLQAILSLLMIIGVFGSVVVFTSDRLNWVACSGMLTLTLGSFGLLLWSLFRRDKAPDFLKHVPGRALERDGFCFKISAGGVKGRCYLNLHFQSRYEGPSRALVVLQPSKGFFLTRPDLASMTLRIECPAGAYGMTSVPWPVPHKLQGRAQPLDVGADVLYPEGRGRMIRYRGGVQVRTTGRDTLTTLMIVAGVLGGITVGMGGLIVLINPARAKLKLPVGVEEWVDDDLPVSTKIVWKLGDDPDHPTSKKGGAVDPDF